MLNSSNDLQASYGTLMEKYKDFTLLSTVQSLVHWDMETKMPPKGGTLRSEQLALLRRVQHRMITNPESGKLLESIRGHTDYDSLSKVEKRNVYLIKKKYDEETKLPEDLVSDLAKQTSVAINKWKEAKAAADFSMFKPELEKLVELKRQQAKLLMEVKGTETPYDALIDIFEPKLTAKRIAAIFDTLKEGLTSIMNNCLAASNQPDTQIFQQTVPIDAQKEVAHLIADFIGYDINSKDAGGRIDETEHPFTTGYYDDVRITTNYHKDDLSAALFSVLHEGGHAIHGQEQKREWIYQPIGSSPSAGFSESQSRFVENIVGRSKDFWIYFLPRLKEVTGDMFSGVDLETFYRAINKVEPSKIRIEADEVTYCLHIIIRFEIERKLIGGDLTVAELPTIWNQKYADYLGVEVENAAEGVLQDTHWASGLYGYFPSYALGNIYSGQILTKMKEKLPDWRSTIADGNFSPIKQWLKKHIYNYGALYDPADLIQKITGTSITAQPYLGYLEEKYANIYDF